MATKKKDSLISKTGYNFIKKAPPKINLHRVIIMIVVIALLAAAGYFGVYTPIREKSSRQSELTLLKTELNALQVQNEKEYDQVFALYSHYTDDYLTEDDKNSLYQRDYLGLLEYHVFPFVTVTSYQIKTNVMVISVSGASLDGLAALTEDLYASGYVKYVKVSSAASGREYAADGTLRSVASITITLNADAFKDGLKEETQQHTEHAEGSVITAPSGTYSDEEIAWQVLRGMWGSGTVRWDALEERGYDPVTIQRLVNEFSELYGIEITYRNLYTVIDKEETTTAAKEGNN